MLAALRRICGCHPACHCITHAIACEPDNPLDLVVFLLQLEYLSLQDNSLNGTLPNSWSHLSQVCSVVCIHLRQNAEQLESQQEQGSDTILGSQCSYPQQFTRCSDLMFCRHVTVLFGCISPAQPYPALCSFWLLWNSSGLCAVLTGLLECNP